MEIWKDIKGFEGHYQVSNLGRVRSIKAGKNLILKQAKHSGGYLKVRLRNAPVHKFSYVHRLVASAFLDEDLERVFVNHKNCNKADNRLENIEWVTRAENGKHAYDNGLLNILEYQKLSSPKLRKPILDNYTGVFYDSFVDFASIHGIRRQRAQKRIYKSKGYYSRFSVYDPN